MARAAGQGRKAKPTALKKAAGNPSGRPLNENEPKYRNVGQVDPPHWMGTNGARLWKVLIAELSAHNVLKLTDIQNLELYCAAYERFRAAEADVMERGIVLTGYGGAVSKNPSVTVSNEAIRQMATVGAMLGLDPSSRTRIQVPSDGEDNPFRRLLRGPDGKH